MTHRDEAGGVIRQLEEDAARRFVRWDPDLWRSILEGPARALSDGLTAAGGAERDALAILESYLRLVSHGIGNGYLFPAAEVHAQSFFTLAFTELVPRLLPSLPAAEQARALALCWNLGENLESAPRWLRQLFLRTSRELRSLGDLEALVARVQEEAFEPPADRLGPLVRAEWIHLGGEDPRFLPGRVHFVAPSVVCVHDRSRVAAAGRNAVTTGVWLSGAPVLLGPMGCDEVPPNAAEALPQWRRVERDDRRFSDVFASAHNDWRAVASLVTSQYVVALVPQGVGG